MAVIDRDPYVDVGQAYQRHLGLSSFWLGNEESKPSTHSLIDQHSDHIADDRAAEHNRVILEGWNLPEQGRANDLDEIEQDVVVDNRALAADHELRFPEYWRDEKCELQQVADDLLKVAEPCAEEGEHDSDPVAVDEEEGDARQCQQAGPAQRNQQEREPEEIQHDVMAEHDQCAQHGAPYITVDADVAGGDQAGIAHERGRPLH